MAGTRNWPSAWPSRCTEDAACSGLPRLRRGLSPMSICETRPKNQHMLLNECMLATVERRRPSGALPVQVCVTNQERMTLKRQVCMTKVAWQLCMIKVA